MKTNHDRYLTPSDIVYGVSHDLDLDHVVDAPTPPRAEVYKTIVEPHETVSPFHRFMQEHRTELVKVIVKDAINQLNIYHPMPVGEVMKVIDTTVGMFLNATEPALQVAHNIWNRLSFNGHYRLVNEHILQLLAISRTYFTNIALMAIMQQVEQAQEGFALLQSLHDMAMLYTSQVCHETLRRVDRALNALSLCTEVVRHATNEQQLLNDICQIVVKRGGYILAWVGIVEEQQDIRHIRPVAQAGYERGYLDKINITWNDHDHDHHAHDTHYPTSKAVSTGKPCSVTNIATDPHLVAWRDEALRRGYASVIALPLYDTISPVGAFTVYSAEINAFDEEEIRLLTNLANTLAYGMKTLRNNEAHAKVKTALMKSETRLRSLIEQNADPIIVTVQGIVEYMNPAAERFFGRTCATMIGTEFGIPMVANEKTEIDVIRKQGDNAVAEMSTVHVEWDGITHCLASFRDITHHKRIERDLEQRIKLHTTHLLHELEDRDHTERNIIRNDVILEAIGIAANRLLRHNTLDDLYLVLENLGIATQVSQVTLFTVHQQQQHTQAILYKTWISADYRLHTYYRSVPVKDVTARHNTDMCMHLYPVYSPLSQQWQGRLQRGLPIYGNTRNFSPHERTMLQENHIYFLLVIPIFVESTWWGCIEFVDCQHQRTWTVAEVESLQTAANIIGAAIQHQQHATHAAVLVD